MHRLSPFVLLLALAVVGCARPQAVRSVAREALPIAVELEASAPRLQERLEQQLTGFAERDAAMSRQTALDAEAVILQEREWKLRGDADRLRRFTLLRERDEAILADPLASLASTPVAPVARNEVPTKDLKAAITALDRLTGAERLSPAQLLGFARSVGDELDKIEAEAASREATANAPQP